MFFLAQVAPVTSSSTDVLQVWLSPQGLTAMVGALTGVLGLLATILTLLGKKELAAKAQAAHDVAATKGTQLVGAIDTIRGLIVAIEQHKKLLSDDDRKQLVATIQTVATQMGAQATLDPLVQAIQGGNTDLSSLVKTLQGALDKLPQPNPPTPTS
jgi:hypothetical protein